MDIYLPIAEIPVNIFVILLIGLVGGILSGIFGIGGGFIATPMLIFTGINPAIAVATSSNQIIASSFSAFLSHLKRRNVDFKMGWVLIIGGFIGSSFGIWIFKQLQQFGQIDLAISLCYILILGSIGITMGFESVFKVLGIKREKPQSRISKVKEKTFDILPFKTDFPKSDLRISILIPLLISFLSGILVSIMGIGGGFIMIPAMIYIIGVPTIIVIGTSLFQVVLVSANVTMLHAINTQSVDIVLALILFHKFSNWSTIRYKIWN